LNEARAQDRTTLLVIALALTAALVRLIPLQWLHPLNWDELEFWRATSWIAQGRLPYRDFWEHHTPLQWFLFAPLTWLSDSPGVSAIIALRWAQIPIWIATFAITNLWMKGAGIGRFARWAAMTAPLASGLFMTPAIEYRVDALGCLLVMAGLLVAQRHQYFASGVIFCLAVFANLRLGPVLVVAAIALLVASRLRAWTLAAGGTITLLICLAFFGATGSLDPLVQQLWYDNLAEKYATPIVGGFIHRLLVPFGLRILGSDRLFELAAFDVGGVLVLVAGFAGLLLAFLRWRERSSLLVIAVVQLANLLFIASMKFIYNYHLLLVAVLMVPLIAAMFDRLETRRVVVAALLLAWGMNVFASVFRGKEHDRAYQDLIMREVDARTTSDERVWSGITWALRREPSYRFWFLPELSRQLVRHNLAPRYALANVMAAPPAAIVFDYNALLWIGTVQRELGPFFVRHYVPVWRELWVPGMNGGLAPGQTREWVVPRSGVYRLYASSSLGTHPWFHDPLRVASYKRPDASRLTVTLPQPVGHEGLRWSIDGRRAAIEGKVTLRAGARVSATSVAREPIGVILLSSEDRMLFRQPPPGATLEGEQTRVTHVPQIGLRLEP
jgi:hypothetical protein